ncbi:tRNA 2-selenouridine(34) synthase MnmH [Paracoccus sp. p4-l81]|uniref:tRNA 2-selenouridine(34) synthase MnmH n=1 Tax=Paracoccus sp. p4-l81 TaxID=3342806 RepID=UPI0035B78FBE
MAITLSSLTDLDRLGFDTLIDARTPLEHAEDHLPGAVNLPVLSNHERAEVGTIYKQVSPFNARRIGAALVARNVAAHLQGPLADKPGGWRPLVYCWRGGQRSQSFATILGQVGWRADFIAGGYKSWRSLVVAALYDRAPTAPVIVLDGNTGSAKTELLNLLPERGVQSIDLEGLANHRGSLFGALGPQPSQRAFEGRLALALARLDPSRPVVVEAESAKVGNCRLPPRLWQAMCAAPRIAIDAPRSARADYLTRAYADVTADASRLSSIIDKLRPYHATDQIAAWQAMAAAGRFTDLADGLMAAHYDPRYGRHRDRMAVPITDLVLDRLTPNALPEAADRLAALILR